MVDILMSDRDKYNAFKRHIGTISNNTAIFSDRFYHPLQEIFKELERQMNVDLRGVRNVKPFQSIEQALNLIRGYRLLRAQLKQFEICVRCLVRCWGHAANYHFGGNTMRLILSVKPELDLCKNFACADVGQFPDVAEPSYKDTALAIAKARGTKTGIPRLPGNALQALRGAAMSTSWDTDTLQRTYTQVLNARSGECTSFGHYAAHLLKEAADASGQGHRIELVVWQGHIKKQRGTETKQVKIPTFRSSRPLFNFFGGGAITKTRDTKVIKPVTTSRLMTHVFCVVNREGGTREVCTNAKLKRTQHRLPDYQYWGDDCWIVDPWLASLGYDSAWPVQQYPKKGMLTPIFLEMDSSQP